MHPILNILMAGASIGTLAFSTMWINRTLGERGYSAWARFLLGVVGGLGAMFAVAVALGLLFAIVKELT